ncbi:AAA family ATPase [Evansella cellulosilytica]|uniref:ATPase associated with various cellular activities AAA_3 n=1 Tax=Evansella cellulosilytica (strain ATCC 21833 / DSM 2522 / FERM P-1141 / JCM 9156 / N-4) TaxID=649639 RepID=E6TX38_EVAC2|nr:MoxR family ATPase [Evansella cellulosilytica]ADU31127.1 ATPase associated with various cellular activities AAA_3 [Evansella cellulosilytica DSM 2522]
MKVDQTVIKNIQENLSKALLGKHAEVDIILTALLAGGHVLLEGVPGTGKTLIVKALARSIHGEYRRVQCNPDLLPTDITGFSIYHPNEKKFIFQQGPIMTNFLLMDEINRASTKTQSALLEAMEEEQVTIDGNVYALPQPFFVMATQNPIDFEGTYVLPEAQLDRFMIKLYFSYPDKNTEKHLLKSKRRKNIVNSLEAVTNIEGIQLLQEQIYDVYVDDKLIDYVLNIAVATRNHQNIYLGVSPRGTQALVHALKALAFIRERNFVTPDDVKHLAPYVFCHRMILKQETRINGVKEEEILQSILKNIEAPLT